MPILKTLKSFVFQRKYEVIVALKDQIPVEDELMHIPEGSTRQQHLFRLIYRIHRMHCLTEGVAQDVRRKALIESCSEVLKEAYPGFKPEFDRKYFLVELTQL